MPTPDDAIVSPVEHESITGRTTCPPEESRIHGLNAAPNSINNDNDDASTTRHVPMQQPTPPRQDSPAETQTLVDTHTKPSSTDTEVPIDIATPMTATDDGTEEQRTSHASPLSATAPVSLLANHLSSPFPAHRVRNSDSVWRHSAECKYR
jgi:hypothetical protein